jgi:integrase
MATISFLIQSNKNPATISVRFSAGRDISLKCKTGFVIDPKSWSPKKKMPKPNDEKSKQTDADLNNFKSKLIEHYNKSISNGEIINANWLKNFINPTDSNNQNYAPNKLVEFIDFFITTKEKAGVVEYNTIKTYKTYRKRISNFRIFENKEFTIYDINESFQSRFNEYSSELNYGKNGTARIIKFLKQIGNNAASYGIKTHVQLNAIKNNFEKNLVVALSKDEVEKLRNTKLVQDYLINARDWLLIGIESGQRASDYLKFNKSNIHIPQGLNKEFIRFSQQKTKKLMYIPLSNQAKLILKKRNGNFPREITSQKLNEYIKEVAKIAMLDEMTRGVKKNPLTNRNELGIYPKHELITSKIARKTFCSMYYGIKPISEIMMISGHTTEKALRDYIGQTDVQQQKILSTFFD